MILFYASGDMKNGKTFSDMLRIDLLELVTSEPFPIAWFRFPRLRQLARPAQEGSGRALDELALMTVAGVGPSPSAAEAELVRKCPNCIACVLPQPEKTAEVMSTFLKF